MDFCFSSGGLDLCGAISRICFLWLPIYCFGFPDNLFSNRICIPATISNFWHNTGSWWRRLLAAEPGSLLEINGHCFGFCPIARPHCLFWRVSTRPGDTRASTGDQLHRFSISPSRGNWTKPLFTANLSDMAGMKIVVSLGLLSLNVARPVGGRPRRLGVGTSLIYNEGLGARAIITRGMHGTVESNNNGRVRNWWKWMPPRPPRPAHPHPHPHPHGNGWPASLGQPLLRSSSSSFDWTVIADIKRHSTAIC